MQPSTLASTPVLPGPGRQDIQSGIGIPIENQTAIKTMMHANLQRLLYNTTTARADLTGMPGIDRHHHTPGLDSLVDEQFAEHSQAGVMGDPGQVAIAKHKVEVQVLNHNRTKAINQLARRLVPEVPAGIRHLFVLPRPGVPG